MIRIPYDDQKLHLNNYSRKSVICTKVSTILIGVERREWRRALPRSQPFLKRQHSRPPPRLSTLLLLPRPAKTRKLTQKFATARGAAHTARRKFKDDPGLSPQLSDSRQRRFSLLFKLYYTPPTIPPTIYFRHRNHPHFPPNNTINYHFQLILVKY